MKQFLESRGRSWAVAALLAALFLALRLPLLRLPYFATEDEFVREALRPLGELNIGGHPILVALFFRLFYLMVGWDYLRVLPFLFSLGVFGMTAVWARRSLGARGAWMACLLLALSPLSVYVSCELEIDGAFFAFFLLVLAWLYARLDEAQGNGRFIRLLQCGAAFGCLWLVNYSAAVALAGLALHSAVCRGWRRTLSDFAVIVLVGAALFRLYPIFFPHHYDTTWQKAAGMANLTRLLRGFSGEPIRFRLYADSLFKAAVFIGPLLFWGLWSALSDAVRRRSLSVDLAVAGVFAAVVLALLNPDRIAIYLAPLVPFFCVMTAKALSDTSVDGQTLADIVPPVVVYLAFFALLTVLGPKTVLAVHPPARMSAKTFLAFLPIRYYFGPSLGLFARPAALLFGFLGCMFLAVISRPWSLRHLAALGLAYNLFYSAEYSYSLFSPNMNRVGLAVLNELKRDPPAGPIYIHGYGLEAQMAGLQAHSFMYDEGFLPRLTVMMSKTGGTVVLFNAPLLGPTNTLRRFLDQDAVLTRVFSDDSVPLAEIWRLKPQAGRRLPEG